MSCRWIRRIKLIHFAETRVYSLLSHAISFLDEEPFQFLYFDLWFVSETASIHLVSLWTRISGSLVQALIQVTSHTATFSFVIMCCRVRHMIPRISIQNSHKKYANLFDCHTDNSCSDPIQSSTEFRFVSVYFGQFALNNDAVHLVQFNFIEFSIGEWPSQSALQTEPFSDCSFVWMEICGYRKRVRNIFGTKWFRWCSSVASQWECDFGQTAMVRTLSANIVSHCDAIGWRRGIRRNGCAL